MAIEKYVVKNVDTKEGWVHFENDADAGDTFRRTTEVHLMATGKKPAVGETHRFNTETSRDGQKFHYYEQEKKQTAQ